MSARWSAPASGKLEVAEDLEFQRRSWRWERAGQGVVAGFVLAAVCGLFGGGPVSRARVAGAGGQLRVDYPRFIRNQSDYRLEIRVEPAAAREGKIRLWIDAALARTVDFESVSPQPEAVDLGRQRLVYQFRVSEDESLAPIVLRGTADAVGPKEGKVGLLAGDSVSFHSFFFP